MSAASRAAERVARDSYGRLLAFLAARTGDIGLAEDALADAFTKALTDWPARGVPDNPDAWLLTVARNRMTDRQRHVARFHTDEEVPDMAAPKEDVAALPDQRLELLMVCAHPAIARDLHTPLMLQTVLGIEAREIARLFMVSPAALIKRLGRAKAKVRDARIPFALPGPEALADRSVAMMEAIYGAHTVDWVAPSDGVGDEAMYLADLLVRLLPQEPEARGLAALIAFGHARSAARVVDDVLVPTYLQDVTLWDDDLRAYGDRQLARAYAMGAPGRFQIEAAIQQVHMARKDRGATDWDALNRLYHALIGSAPSAGALVAQAVVTARVHGAQAGLDALERVEPDVGVQMQALWAARAEMLSELGAAADAHTAYDKAMSLAAEPPLVAFLKARRAALPASE
ncbi:RNA polymerase sigma factor [Tateyamaria sp. SN3-11]|uniref:RNA polymerase sigma factor n=1 Tax=Tateyamaria sp. SN3-11 TaxID=3092147 RepID=UPI0039EC0983